MQTCWETWSHSATKYSGCHCHRNCHPDCESKGQHIEMLQPLMWDQHESANALMLCQLLWHSGDPVEPDCRSNPTRLLVIHTVVILAARYPGAQWWVLIDEISCHQACAGKQKSGQTAWPLHQGCRPQCCQTITRVPGRKARVLDPQSALVRGGAVGTATPKHPKFNKIDMTKKKNGHI